MVCKWNYVTNVKIALFVLILLITVQRSYTCVDCGADSDCSTNLAKHKCDMTSGSSTLGQCIPCTTDTNCVNDNYH